MSRTLFAPAKINLWLRIFPPDATGYHPLDTLFCALDLSDEITIELVGNEIQLTVEGTVPGPAHDNLAYRAAQEFFLATGITPRASIRLHKRIPAGAGLGGGSSDAAGVLRGLNELHEGVLSPEDLLHIGARLGSDVAFFLCDSKLAHATGRGEQLRVLSPLPSLPTLVLVPDFAIATADAYRWLDDDGVYSTAPDRSLAAPRSWDDIIDQAHNAFERIVFRRYPTLAHAKAACRASGALVALLSGSGSTLFGIYGSEPERDQAAISLRHTLPRVSILTTKTSC